MTHTVWLDEIEGEHMLLCTGCDWATPAGWLEDDLAAAIGHSGDRDALADRMTLDPAWVPYVESLRAAA